jgi:putative oxidoreductase
MAVFVQTVKKWYLTEIWALDRAKHVFLLLLRLYFGWGFISAGLGKLLNVETHTGFFRDWGIPLPTFNVYMAGTTETVCGFLLMIGAASRLITIPLIGTMLVAYLTAHTEQFYALFDSETRATFFKAPPFPYLFTCLVVLFFGPGRISIDRWVKSVLECQHHNRGNTSAGTANGRMTSSNSPASINPDMKTFSS